MGGTSIKVADDARCMGIQQEGRRGQEDGGRCFCSFLCVLIRGLSCFLREEKKQFLHGRKQTVSDAS